MYLVWYGVFVHMVFCAVLVWFRCISGLGAYMVGVLVVWCISVLVVNVHMVQVYGMVLVVVGVGGCGSGWWSSFL